jgi:hypothetical protein
MQLSPLQAPHDRSSAHPKVEQLLPADHPVLSLRNLRHPSVNGSSVKLGTSTVPKLTLSFHTGDAETPGRACGAQFMPIRRLNSSEIEAFEGFAGPCGGTFGPGSSPYESRLTV